MAFRMRVDTSEKIARLENNDSLWSLGYYRREGVMLQINNNVRGNVIYCDLYIYQALSGQFPSCNLTL